MEQQNLFEQNSSPPSKENEVLRPLPYRVRPQTISEFVGWEELRGRYPFLQQRPLPALIFWGPPGSGKTTLGQLLADHYRYHFQAFSAVMGSLAELRQLMELADNRRRYQGDSTILFVDEIHRFNKAQQDALLPHVEAGHFTLIGATTENPKAVINRALLSRIQTVELLPLTPQQLQTVLLDALKKVRGPLFPEEVWDLLTIRADGDARRALNYLDLLIQLFPAGFSSEEWNEKLKQSLVRSLFQNKRDYDRQGNRHYDVISAFIKSLRGSDPDAALLWLAVMLDGGEDPLFIARRLMIFASEDIGNSDPWAIMMATSTFTALTHIGMPEGRILLGQTTSYLAATVKSNAAYLGIEEAIRYVEENPTIQTPAHLKNPSSDYLYPHNYEGHFVQQKYTTNSIPHFYRPTVQGREKFLKERLQTLWKREQSD